MSHAPWSKEEAEVWAVEFANRIHNSAGIQAAVCGGYLAGLAKAAEVIKERKIEEVSRRHDEPLSEQFRAVIDQWKFSWMDVQGTDERDRKNYRNRAFGIDANMSWDLAQRLIAMIEASPTVFWRETSKSDKWLLHMTKEQVFGDTHQAKLVGVRKIGEGE